MLAQSSSTDVITLLSLLSDYLYAMLTESHQPTTHFSRPCKLDLQRLREVKECNIITIQQWWGQVFGFTGKYKGAREAVKPRYEGGRYRCGSSHNRYTILSSSQYCWPELGSSTVVAEGWVSSWKHIPSTLPYKLNGPWTILWHQGQMPISNSSCKQDICIKITFWEYPYLILIPQTCLGLMIVDLETRISEFYFPRHFFA